MRNWLNLFENTTKVLYHGGDNHEPHDLMFFSEAEQFAEDYGEVRSYEVDLGRVFDSLDHQNIEPLLPLHDTYDDAEISSLDDYDQRSSDTWEMLEAVVSSVWSTGADSLLVTEGGYVNYLVRDKSRIRLLT
jgi:hypothetical protein